MRFADGDDDDMENKITF